MAAVVAFEVFGKPTPQGSTREVPIRDKGGGFKTRPDGRPMLRPVHDKAAELRSWRQAVASAAREAYDGPLLDGPLALVVVFERPRPKGHFGTGRNAHKLKASAPAYPTTKPDSIKLVRAVEDALTGVLWCDDSQVCGHEIYKQWGDVYRTSVKIETLSR